MQATTVVHRLAGAFGDALGGTRGGRPGAPVAAWPATPATPAGADASAAGGAAVAAARRVRDALVAAERDRWDAVLATARDDPALAGVLTRALAGGAPVTAVGALATLWPGLDPRERAGVGAPLGSGAPGPLRVGGALARQADGTTCGSAVLTMLAAAGDPVLALWLVTGRLVPGYTPPELRGVGAAALRCTDAGRRLAAVQWTVKRASTRRALGPLPWPAALGTPPWGAARVARSPGVRFSHHPLDDTDHGHLDRALERVDAALAAGVPVPVFTGGDLGTGVLTAVPRHVVLLLPVPATADPGRAYAVLEPGQGRVHHVPRGRLAAPGGPHPALGGWSHVCWVLLPTPTRGGGGPQPPRWNGPSSPTEQHQEER